jgi:hypothetical protein
MVDDCWDSIKKMHHEYLILELRIYGIFWKYKGANANSYRKQMVEYEKRVKFNREYIEKKEQELSMATTQSRIDVLKATISRVKPTY